MNKQTKKTTQAPEIAISRPVTPEEHAYAYERWAAERAALGSGSLRRPRRVSGVVAVMRDALPRLAGESKKLATLPGFTKKTVDELREQWVVMAKSHQGWKTARRTASEAPESGEGAERRSLISEGLELRLSLAQGVRSLSVKGGPLGAKTMKSLALDGTYEGLADDLASLSALFREKWSKVDGKSLVTLEQVARAEEVSNALLAARAVSSEVLATASDDRQRAFTLAVTTYERIRTGLLFIYGDESVVDAIAPSLATVPVRKVKKGPAKKAPAEKAPEAAPSTPPTK